MKIERVQWRRVRLGQRRPFITKEYHKEVYQREIKFKKKVSLLVNIHWNKG